MPRSQSSYSAKRRRRPNSKPITTATTPYARAEKKSTDLKNDSSNNHAITLPDFSLPPSFFSQESKATVRNTHRSLIPASDPRKRERDLRNAMIAGNYTYFVAEMKTQYKDGDGFDVLNSMWENCFLPHTVRELPYFKQALSQLVKVIKKFKAAHATDELILDEILAVDVLARRGNSVKKRQDFESILPTTESTRTDFLNYLNTRITTHVKYVSYAIELLASLATLRLNLVLAQTTSPSTAPALQL